MRRASEYSQTRNNSVERKAILSVVLFACVLFSIGLGVIINLFLLTPSHGLAASLFGSLALPACTSAFIFRHYYKHHFVPLATN
ncbi:hypothetical protein HHX48_17665 [Salinimonas sp. HHU 13199]|uniref:Uncharacterized protein n=1 Tax=Salinimonas profundi TaxID=2729140 RepID=A0ABR8LTV0_9ALTE|nr:hypothetical protein [Salinimonas profundi]MBD3587569.1 hypothetical protein [Salinimonas profundi]